MMLLGEYFLWCVLDRDSDFKTVLLVDVPWDSQFLASKRVIANYIISQLESIY